MLFCVNKIGLRQKSETKEMWRTWKFKKHSYFKVIVSSVLVDLLLCSYTRFRPSSYPGTKVARWLAFLCFIACLFSSLVSRSKVGGKDKTDVTSSAPFKCRATLLCITQMTEMKTAIFSLLSSPQEMGREAEMEPLALLVTCIGGCYCMRPSDILKYSFEVQMSEQENEAEQAVMKSWKKSSTEKVAHVPHVAL